jgi:phosphatidylglycerophosphatase A
VVILLCIIGIPICDLAARQMGRGSDPGSIVWDEMASVPLGLLLVPAGERTPLVFLAAFLLHRLFDIWKPFPCRQLDEGHGGLGIMADDWGAAAWMAFGLAVGRQAGWW